MEKYSLDQGEKQYERVHRILPTLEMAFKHPYCDKNDSHWYNVARNKLRLSSGAFEIIKNAQILSYFKDEECIKISDYVEKSNIFSFISPQLISFAGVVEEKAYLFSRPLSLTSTELIFPTLQELKKGNYDRNGMYFKVREINADQRDMKMIVDHFNSFK